MPYTELKVRLEEKDKQIEEKKEKAVLEILVVSRDILSESNFLF
jgi:hypothetical protein